MNYTPFETALIEQLLDYQSVPAPADEDHDLAELCEAGMIRQPGHQS